MPEVSPIPPPGKVIPEMGKIVRPTAGKVFIRDTGSMRASGFIGDQWVDMETPKMEDIKEGDFILYENPAKGVITGHEVKRVKKAANGGIYFLCKGSSNGEIDNINVDHTNYIGRFTIPSKAEPSFASPIQMPAKVGVP